MGILIISLASIGGVLFVVIAIAISRLPNLESASLRAYVSASNSMCPTVCEHERILVDSSFYASHPLQRGDVVMYQYPEQPSLYLKRVVALPGDTVSVDPQGTISVNGSAIAIPLHPVCGEPQSVDSADAPVFFQRTTLPEGGIFLIGDNLSNSFDSRIAEFRPATNDRVRGKVLLIYWSTGSGRIGCKVE